MTISSVKRQRGSIAIMVGIGMLVLTGFVGVALDIGRTTSTKAKVQDANDAAVLSAAAHYYRNLPRIATQAEEACNLVNANLPAGTVHNNCFAREVQSRVNVLLQEAINVGNAQFSANYGRVQPVIAARPTNNWVAQAPRTGVLFTVPRAIVRFDLAIEDNVDTTLARVIGADDTVTIGTEACADWSGTVPLNDQFPTPAQTPVSRLVRCGPPPTICAPQEWREVSRGTCSAPQPQCPSTQSSGVVVATFSDGCGAPVARNVPCTQNISCPPPPACPVYHTSTIREVIAVSHNSIDLFKSLRVDNHPDIISEFVGISLPVIFTESTLSTYSKFNYNVVIDDKSYTALVNRPLTRQALTTILAEPPVAVLARWDEFNFDVRGRCYSLTRSRSILTPISLFWGLEGRENTPEALIARLQEQRSITAFPLYPDAGEDRRFEWFASGVTPLLVYDPEQTGVITSPTQLFGNHTFGKKWKDGYAALASLDKDNNGVVEGGELKGLSLWFDQNQDGISQKGEVKPLARVGVTGLFYGHDYTDPAAGHLIALNGYRLERKNGESVILPSVDWFGREFRVLSDDNTANISDTGSANAAGATAAAGSASSAAGGQGTGGAAASTALSGSKSSASSSSGMRSGSGSAAGSGGSASGGGGAGGSGAGASASDGEASSGSQNDAAAQDNKASLEGLWLWSDDHAPSPQKDMTKVDNNTNTGVFVLKAHDKDGLYHGENWVYIQEIMPLLSVDKLYQQSFNVKMDQIISPDIMPLNTAVSTLSDNKNDAYFEFLVYYSKGESDFLRSIVTLDKKNNKLRGITHFGSFEQHWTAIRVKPEQLVKN